MSKRLAGNRKLRAASRRGPSSRREAPRPNRFHAFLKRLRAGGRTNMYGAIPYLMHAFELDREAAFRIVCEWVDLQREETGAVAEPVSGGR